MDFSHLNRIDCMAGVPHPNATMRYTIMQLDESSNLDHRMYSGIRVNIAG